MMNDLFFKEVLKHSFNYPVKVKFADGKTEQYGGDGTPEATITFNGKISIPDLIKNASLCLGEAYMDMVPFSVCWFPLMNQRTVS